MDEENKNLNPDSCPQSENTKAEKDSGSASAEENEETIKEVDAEETDKTESDTKNEDVFKNVKQFFKKFWNKSKKFFRDTADTVSNYFAEQQQINALNKLFEEESEKFTDVKTGRDIYAVVSDDGKMLLMRKDGDGTLFKAESEVKKGSHLSRDNKIYKVMSLDKGFTVPYKKAGNSVALECYKAEIEEVKEEKNSD